MLIRKTAGFFLAALLLAAGLPGIFAARPRSASAETAPVSLTNENASLFLPETYEQYLALQKPSDVAMSASYIAIADGQSLYLFDKKENKYFVTPLEERRTISKIGFTTDERLFISDTGAGNRFYEYSFDDHNLKQIPKINCSTFCISGDKLYTATVSQDSSSISEYSISEIESEGLSPHDLGNLNNERTTPSMTFLDGILYCTIGEHVYYNDLSTKEQFNNRNCIYLSLNAYFNRNVKSTCAHKGAFYYTADGGLYRAELSTTDNNAKKAICVLEGEDFGTLTSYGGSIYCIRGTSVLKLSVADDGTVSPTDYEISSSSASVGRLSGATDVVRAGSLVVVADTENKRVTVYDGDTETYSVLAPEGEDFSPTLVATDGTLVAAVSGDKVYVCNNPKKSAEFENPVTVNSTIKGIACVFGKVYYVTLNNIQGVLNGESTTKSNGGSPTFMTSDLYGNLYVAYNNNPVRSFTEEEFITHNAEGTLLNGVTIPTEAKTLRAGFDGTLYYLDEEGNLHSTKEKIANIDGKEFVYTGGESKQPTSFALGFEDDEVYFLFGDFIVKTNADALGLPSVGRLSDAEDIVRAGDLLVTADTGNNRVTVYDMQKRSFAVIQTEFSPALVATDGEVIAAASGNKVYVCTYGDNSFGEPLTADLGTIKGLACVHGNVYYITEYGYGKVEEEDKGLISRLEGSLEALAADANGILYVVDTSGHVRYYYEDEFANPDVASGGDADLTLRMPISSLRADCKGNLYYIHENEIWKNDTLFFKIDNDSYVYGDENELISFALGFEDDEVFLLYGNRIIKTAPGKLDIPTLGGIDTFVSHIEMLLPHEKGRRYYL